MHDTQARIVVADNGRPALLKADALYPFVFNGVVHFTATEKTHALPDAVVSSTFFDGMIQTLLNTASPLPNLCEMPPLEALAGVGTACEALTNVYDTPIGPAFAIKHMTNTRHPDGHVTLIGAANGRAATFTICHHDADPCSLCGCAQFVPLGD
jgi:hypothetical protein